MAIITPPMSGSLSSLYGALMPGGYGGYGARYLSSIGGLGAFPSTAAPAVTPAPQFTGGGAQAPSTVVAAPDTSGLPFNVSDYENDPIVGRTRALVESQTKEAEARALANKRNQLIRFGDPEMVRKILGGQAGDTVGAAQNNPFSTTHDLDVWNARSLTGIDETRNAQNLFYSTTRARERSLQEEGALRAKAQASNQLQDVLTGIQQDVTNIKNAGLQQILAAEESAYNRALQRALSEQALAAAAAAGGGGGAPSGGGGAVVVDSGGGQPMVVPAPTPTYDFVTGRPPAAIGGPGGIPE